MHNTRNSTGQNRLTLSETLSLSNNDRSHVSLSLFDDCFGHDWGTRVAPAGPAQAPRADWLAGGE